MGPKKGKDVFDENSWRTIIEETLLDEDTCKVKVIMIEAAASDQDRIYLNKFELFAAEEKRFVIKNICKTETIFMVNQLGGEKKVKDDDLRVFEEGQAYLKDKKDIPPDIWALIIKYLILKMKEEYLFIKRQKLEVKEGMRRESTIMINRTEIKGAVGVKPPEPAQISPPGPKGKTKKEERDPPSLIPEPSEGKKYNTLLRVRGEEWRDKVYVDDFPTDGPNLYVAVTGFVEPLLPGCLIKIGIPLSAIVQIKIDPMSTTVPSSLFKTTKRGQSQTEMLTEKYFKFWDDLQILRISENVTDDFKNTAFIVFSPPYWDTESLSGTPDKIYDELCYLMYDVQDLTRQHGNYLENMHIIPIPQDINEEGHKAYYHMLIDDLPSECVTIFSLLDSILEVVCHNEENDVKNSKTSLSTAVTISQPPKTLADEEKVQKAECLVKDVVNALCKTEANRKTYRLTYGEEYEDHKDPKVINYGDFVQYSTFHLGNINLDNIVWSSLFGMPLHNLWNQQNRPHGELEAKINFHVNVLLSCFERQDVETSELNRLIHILSCRKLYNNRSSLKKIHLPSSAISEFKKIYLKRSVLAEPLLRTSSVVHSFGATSPSFSSISRSENVTEASDEPDHESYRIKFLFDCPDISQLVSAAEIANDKPMKHIIDDFEFFEDFSGVSSFQIMFDAYNKFNCIDYKYCSVTDCFVLMFFNSHDKDGISREEWRSHLSTPLCLQDFFDFVLEEHYDWIQNEERIYDEKMHMKTQSKENNELTRPLALKSCIDDTEVDLDLLMEGSLKYQEIDVSPESSEMQIASTKKSYTSPSSTEFESKSSKKPKSPASLKKQSYIGTAHSDSVTELPCKPFIGYQLGDRRVEVFGKDVSYFSDDGTHILSMYILIIPMNIEYVTMSVVPGNSYNEFWFHKYLGEATTPEIIDACESFRITTKDHVLINIKKQSYNIPIPTAPLSSTETNNPKKKQSIVKRPSSKPCVPDNIIFEKKAFHALFITCPNGLITETVYKENSPTLSHIKQYYLSSKPNVDEHMRCITLTGEVILFKTSGEIEVLMPDGTYINITKYGKRLITPSLPDEISEVSSDKSKKTKGNEKDKRKDKTAKVTSKSSKNILEDEPDDNPPECYKLVIDEFEVIETSGLRQKWINDKPLTIEKLLIRTATDYCVGQIFSRRMDGTDILLNKDGVQIVTFPDNTRIITTFLVDELEVFPEWTDEEKEYFNMVNDSLHTNISDISKASLSQKSYVGTNANSSIIESSTIGKIEEEQRREKERTEGYILVHIIYTIENAHFTTVTIDTAAKNISMESANNTKVVINPDNNYSISLDKMTTADFNGENLHIKYEACSECRSFTTCDIKIISDEISSVTKLQQHWLRMTDSFSKRIVVDGEGDIHFIETPCFDQMDTQEEAVGNEEVIECDGQATFDGKSESSVISHGKCREMYLARKLRFFVLRRELTCSELVHRALLDQYKRDCRWQPWCSINEYDAFGDNRSLLSLLTPVHLTETEKWMMDSKFANKPKYLTYKDLKKDSGKGFYHWMRPYGRFEPKPMSPQNVLPPRLPRAFIHRTLEQQWKEADRETYKGARELLTAILKYRRVMEDDCESLLHVPIVDPRTEDERKTDDAIQAFAHRIFENLKRRLADDVESRTQATITTKSAPQTKGTSIEGELEEETEAVDEQKVFKEQEEEHRSLVEQLENIEEISPALKRYWRRRAEELKEEQFYQYLLREGSVPPYFRNVLGGAMWWEMNNVTGEAVTSSETKKTKCVCAEDSTRDQAVVEPFI